MAATQVGELLVKIGADASGLASGMRAVDASFTRFATRIGAVLATTVVAGLATASVVIKKTINQMDELSKTSQKIGFPVERLSAWGHAADLAGTSVQGMTSGIKALSRLMDEAAVEGSRGAEIFERLGISVRNADGTMRSVEETLLDVADRFAGMSDGVTKTALAQELLKKGGLEMIPLLNQGAAGIRAMTAEAERLGLTFSTRSAQAAEQFNDNITRLGAVVRGLVVQFTEGITPALATLSDKLVAMAGSTDLAKNAGVAFGNFLLTLPEKLLTVAKHIDLIGMRWKNLIEVVFETPLPDVVTVWNRNTRAIEETSAAYDTQIRRIQWINALLPVLGESIRKEQEERAKLNKTQGDGNVLTQEEIAARQALIDQGEAYREALRAEGDALTESVQGPMEQYRARLTEIQALQAQGAISAETAGRAQVMAAATVANAYLQVASTAATALAGLFEDNKAVAIAAAIINTLEGITAAFKLPFPLNWIQAASVAAAGFAQVQRIRATRPGGGSTAAPSLRGGGGARGGGGGDGGGGGGQTASLTVVLQGSGGFTRDQVRGLVGQIAELGADGGLSISVTG